MDVDERKWPGLAALARAGLVQGSGWERMDSRRGRRETVERLRGAITLVLPIRPG